MSPYDVVHSPLQVFSNLGFLWWSLSSCVWLQIGMLGLQLTLTLRIAVVVLAGGPGSSACQLHLERFGLNSAGNWGPTHLSCFPRSARHITTQFLPSILLYFFPPITTRSEFSPVMLKKSLGRGQSRPHIMYTFGYQQNRLYSYFSGLPSWLSGKEPACHCRRCKRCGFDPWVGKIPWRRKWQPTPVFSPGKSCRQRSLEGSSLWSHKTD